VRKRRLVLPLLLVIGLLALPAASQAYTTGVADQNAAMFTSPLFTQLHTKISRYIAPYDVADGNRKNTAPLNQFINWYNHAKALNIQVFVAFYHSEITPTRLPSTKLYTKDIQKFMKKFPAVKIFQPYNEANRGNVPRQFSSPSASLAAQYYVALKRVCKHCTIAGLDVLDGPSIAPTIRYIRGFQSALGRMHSSQPSIWGLHNYSDTNRNRTSGTRAVLAATHGQLWLTETGGVVKLGSSFTNRNGSGIRRAASALKQMFKLAGLSGRISRLYIFQWTGANANARFDAGLTAADGRTPRPGYVVVCQKLLHNAKSCNVKTTTH
jgi:hypothetical protein